MAEGFPFRVAATLNRDPLFAVAIGAGVDAVWGVGGVVVAAPGSVLAGHGDGEELLAHVHGDRFPSGGVDELAFARAIAVQDSSDHCEGGGGAGAEVDGAAHLGRRTVGVAGEVREAGEGGEGGRVADVVALGASSTDGAGGDHDELGANGVEMVVAEAEFVEGAGAEVVDCAVGSFGQLFDDLLGFWRLEVERDGAFVEVELVEHGRLVVAAFELARGEGAQAAVVHAGGAFDLDDFRAKQGELQRAIGTGPGPGEVDETTSA